MTELIPVEKLTSGKMGRKWWSLDCPLVYGPITSRRYGFSLGINLLPVGLKICNFDCLYCQCGWTPRSMVLNSFSGIPFPSLDEIEKVLAVRFRELSAETVIPETIVFSGNGEPTLYPAFAEAVELVRQYGKEYFPGVPLGILTNGTRVSDPAVFETMARLDWKSVKLDAGVEWMDRPISAEYCLDRLMALWSQLPNLTIQSFFSEGRFDNTAPEMVQLWIERIRRIGPSRVQVYTLDRIPAATMIRPASLNRLTQVARMLANQTGIRVEVFD